MLYKGKIFNLCKSFKTCTLTEKVNKFRVKQEITLTEKNPENLTHEYESVQNKNTQAFILKQR